MCYKILNFYSAFNVPPGIINPEATAFKNSHIISWLLYCILDGYPLTPNWAVIYSPITFGTSWHNFVTTIMDYKGPTVVLIEEKNGAILGGYTSGDVWANTSDFKEDSSAFIFSLYPHFTVLRSIGFDTHHFIFNSSRGHLPAGFGYGGKLRSYRLWINEDLQSGTSNTTEGTYQEGNIAEPHFTIDKIEIIGIGGEEALAGQQKERNRTETIQNAEYKILKQLGVDRWDKGATRMVMDLAGRTGVSDPFLQDLKEFRKRNKQLKQTQNQSQSDHQNNKD